MLRFVLPGLLLHTNARTLQRGLACMLMASMLLMVGCSQPPVVPATAAGTQWTGRLALQVADQTSQSFFATFELTGSPQQGRLLLLTPLGNTLAQIQWSAGHAEINTGQATRTSDSLDTLLRDIMGTDIPVAALFSWLQGTHLSATGWEVDLSAIEQGRLVAQRHSPAPQATLRIALTR